MKLYRVHIEKISDDSSQGYNFIKNKIDLNKFTVECASNGCRVSSEIIDVDVSEDGIIKALNRYGGHANNG